MSPYQRILLLHLSACRRGIVRHNPELAAQVPIYFKNTWWHSAKTRFIGADAEYLNAQLDTIHLTSAPDSAAFDEYCSALSLKSEWPYDEIDSALSDTPAPDDNADDTAPAATNIEPETQTIILNRPAKKAKDYANKNIVELRNSLYGASKRPNNDYSELIAELDKRVKDGKIQSYSINPFSFCVSRAPRPRYKTSEPLNAPHPRHYGEYAPDTFTPISLRNPPQNTKQPVKSGGIAYPAEIKKPQGGDAVWVNKCEWSADNQWATLAQFADKQILGMCVKKSDETIPNWHIILPDLTGYVEFSGIKNVQQAGQNLQITLHNGETHFRKIKDLIDEHNTNTFKIKGL
jgi:hypothetical protein